MIRAFLGFALPAEVREALVLQQFLLPMPQREPPENLHLTLVFLGEQPAAVLQTLHDDLLRAPPAPVALGLRGIGMFGQARPRLVYADVGRDAALLALQARLEGLARRAGASVPARRFHPHVTLGRFPPMPPGDRAMRLERAVALGGGFALGPFASGPVVLFRSDAAGARRHYSALARYGEPG